MKLLPPREGIIAALWIPLDARDRVLKHDLGRHLAWLRANGIQGVLALGSTGEFIRMDLAQREAVLAQVVELAAPLPVIANLSSIRLGEVVALGRTARRAGAVGAALMPPHFFPVSQADLLAFFLAAADRVALPFYLYNFPELTNNRIGLETVAAFAERADMVGIKQSGGEFDYHQPLIQLGREKNFVVFTGADTRLPEAFALGAAGCIGGLANFVPESMGRIFQHCRAGRAGEAREPAAHMTAVGRIVDQLSFPLNVACGLEARGFNPGFPKTVVSAETARIYRRTVADFRRLFVANRGRPVPPRFTAP